MSEHAKKRLWKGLGCSDCGRKFEVGDKVIVHKNSYVREFFCEECYDRLYLDV